jgi:hypothetical protein
MEVWFYLGTTGREANTRGEEIKKNLHPRSSEARRESFCPLDNDLSWKSRSGHFKATFPISAAGSKGRRNTSESFDPAALPLENPLKSMQT